MSCSRPSAQTSGSAASRSNDVLPFKATETTLPNGLKVIVIPTGFPNLVSVQVSVQTGSRNEVEPGKSGFAHFFEHLMFRGTPKTPPEKYRQIMAKAGARDNASTGDDATHYYSTFAKEDLETILDVYADMFQNLSYPEADFKTEARAILGEYNKNSAEPLEKLFEVQRDHFYQAHTYKHTTMGFIKDIENMPNEYAYSKVFFERWYRPQFTTLIVAGDVTTDRVMPLVEKYWDHWKGGSSTPVQIPKEPAPNGPKYAHVPWTSDTLPWVTVAFPGPAFDENAKESAAVEMIGTIYFGQTSDLYKKLVVAEQKVDQLFVDTPSSVDSALFTAMARVKSPADAVYVRDQLLSTFAKARFWRLPSERLAEAKSNTRYSFARTIDSTERVAAIVAAYAPYKRSYETANNFYRALDSLTPADLQATAAKYFTDDGLIVTTLSKDALPSGIEKADPLKAPDESAVAKVTARSALPPSPRQPKGTTAGMQLIVQKSPSPLLNFKLLFGVGSANDPAGKEGLSALTAAMVTRGGSKAMLIEQVDAALYPMAATFSARADKEMTAITGVIHRDNWGKFLDVALPQLVDNGWWRSDFERLKTQQMNALVQDLRSSNEEELGKERLQANVFRDTPYGHVALGTVAGLQAITLDDVKSFARSMYTRANLTVGINGDVSDDMLRDLDAWLRSLPEGPAASRSSVQARRPSGVEVEILEKDTRAVALSLGFPIDVTRSHPDFVALSVARSWLGEHRLSSGDLYQRIREERGMNYGDYAYIEAFPRGMFQFFPDPNAARSRQLFEIWIRPVVPANAQMSLRIALYELQKLIRNGLTTEQFEATRDYLMKNVYVMTARQDQQLGYALDSKWYGIPDFTEYMRAGLSKLTLDEVNAAIKRHLNAENLSIVIVAKDAQGLKQALVADAFSPIKYDGAKDKALLDEDRVIGAMKLHIPASNVTVTPIADVFAK
ncbi:MAG TPA: pitrilysin family protein [Vicinamibacterales bacterium]|nr:pitrilysin family protein [Vicinamibacterales bacterium]